METPTVQISRFNIPAPLAVAAWVGFGVPVFVWTVESFRATVGDVPSSGTSSTGDGFSIPPGTPDALVGPIVNMEADARPLPIVQGTAQVILRALGKIRISIPFA